MNAFPSPAHHSGANDPAPDPSMEEILASIRRIIADDQGLAPPAQPIRPSASVYRAPGPSHNHAHNPAPEPQMHAAPTQPRFEPVQQAPQPVTIEAEALAPASQAFAQQAPQQYAAPQRPAQPQQYAPQPAHQPVHQPAQHHTSQPVQQAPAYAGAGFAAPMVASPPPETALLSAQTDASVANAFEALTRTMMLQNSPFMEETVRDLLRPMLKQWLDDNLPPLVERLVRSEIERVARGGR